MYKYVLLVAILCGCGGDENVTLSGAEFYEELFTADCVSAVRCGFLDASEIDACVDAEVQIACSANLDVCREQYTVNAGELEACYQETEDRSCAAVAEGILPSECLTIEELI